MRAASMILLLNLTDAIFTLVYVQAGIAREANPLMHAALASGAVTFMVLKLALVGCAVAVLVYLVRTSRVASLALSAAAIGYGALVLYQLAEVPRLFG